MSIMNSMGTQNPYKNKGGILYRNTGGTALTPENYDAYIKAYQDWNKGGRLDPEFPEPNIADYSAASSSTGAPTTSTAVTPGTPTIPDLPGVASHENLNDSIPGSGPIITASMTPEEITQAYITWASDPANIPDYYGGATVAEFDPAQIAAFDQKEELAKEQDRLNLERLGTYESWLDPESEAQMQAQQRAAQTAGSTFYGAGTPGSARSQIAASAAALDAQQGLQSQALSGIEGVQDDLTAGADILSGVGAERRQYVQDVINEDIKRWNFAQLAPQQQWDKLLGLANQLKGMELGTLVDSGGDSVPAWKSILASVAGPVLGDAGSGILDAVLGLFNKGGPVYKQSGGILGGDPMMGQQPPMQPTPTPPAPKGIMGNAMPPAMGETMQMTMVSEEPISEIDKAEGILKGLEASSGGSIKVIRKTKKKGGKSK